MQYKDVVLQFYVMFSQITYDRYDAFRELVMSDWQFY